MHGEEARDGEATAAEAENPELRRRMKEKIGRGGIVVDGTDVRTGEAAVSGARRRTMMSTRL